MADDTNPLKHPVLSEQLLKLAAGAIAVVGGAAYGCGWLARSSMLSGLHVGDLRPTRESCFVAGFIYIVSFLAMPFFASQVLRNGREISHPVPLRILLIVAAAFMLVSCELVFASYILRPEQFMPFGKAVLGSFVPKLMFSILLSRTSLELPVGKGSTWYPFPVVYVATLYFVVSMLPYRLELSQLNAEWGGLGHSRVAVKVKDPAEDKNGILVAEDDNSVVLETDEGRYLRLPRQRVCEISLKKGL